MRCDIVICNSERVERYLIPDREVPPGSYSGGGQPASWLDAARITVHTFAWEFFDPEMKTTLDKFAGTDCRSELLPTSLPSILVYVTDKTPQGDVEALVNALSEEFAVPETADAR
jgi:hypothetical protein